MECMGTPIFAIGKKKNPTYMREEESKNII
jgi:hypothetical protein